MSEKMPDELEQYVNFAVKFYKAMHDGQVRDLWKYWNLMRVIKSEEWFYSSMKKNFALVIRSIYAKLDQINNLSRPFTSNP